MLVLPDLIFSLMTIFGAIALLVAYMSWLPTFCGVGVLAICLPLELCLIGGMLPAYGAAMVSRASLTKVLSELLRNMKSVKANTLEPEMYQRIGSHRGTQLGFIGTIQSLTGWLYTIMVAKGFIAYVVMFVSFVFLPADRVCPGGRSSWPCKLEPAQVIASITLNILLVQALNTLPSQISLYVQASVSYGRILRLLLSDESPLVDQMTRPLPEPEPGVAFCLRNASFGFMLPKVASAEPQATTNSAADQTDPSLAPAEADGSLPNRGSKVILSKLSLEIQEGEQIAIIGPNGSGKTMLLAALNNEWQLVGGHAARSRVPVAFAAQKADLRPGTIQSNILGEHAMDRAHYEAVLEACALKQDLATMAIGDMTVCGESGLRLSGGQRQRVALAAALYCNAPVVMVDDVASALDRITARHIHEKLYKGHLKGKTVLSTTQSASLALEFFPRVVVMAEPQTRPIVWTAKAELEIPIYTAHIMHLLTGNIKEGADVVPSDLKVLSDAMPEVEASVFREFTIQNGYAVYKPPAEGQDHLDVDVETCRILFVGTPDELREKAKTVPELARIVQEETLDNDQRSVAKQLAARATSFDRPEERRAKEIEAIEEQQRAASKEAKAEEGEKRAIGGLSWEVIRAYLNHGGGVWIFVLLLVLGSVASIMDLSLNMTIVKFAADHYDEDEESTEDPNDAGNASLTDPANTINASLTGTSLTGTLRTLMDCDIGERVGASASLVGQLIDHGKCVDAKKLLRSTKLLVGDYTDPIRRAVFADHTPTPAWAAMTIMTNQHAAHLLRGTLERLTVPVFGMDLNPGARLIASEIDGGYDAGAGVSGPGQEEVSVHNETHTPLGYTDVVSQGNLVTREQFFWWMLCWLSLYVFLQGALSFVSVWSALRASRRLFKNVLVSVMRARQSVFDETPVPRIVNRMTSDMATIDDTLATTMRVTMYGALDVVKTHLYFAAVLQWFALILLPFDTLIVFMSIYYRSVNRDVKRLEAVARTNTLKHVFEAYTFGPTSRAYGWCDDLARRSSKGHAIMQQQVASDWNNWVTAFWNLSVTNCWLNMGISVLSLLVGCVVLLAVNVLAHAGKVGEEYDGAFLGLVVGFSFNLQWGMITFFTELSNTEAALISVERIKEYTDGFEAEAVRVVGEEMDPDHPDDKGEVAAWEVRAPADWPLGGAIVFRDVEMRYRADLPLVLRSISFSIAAGERVGIVGRTGSGKTSTILAILRLVEIDSGAIEIDGLNTQNVTLHELRSRIGVVMQDPLIFYGSLRDNIDPASEHSEDKVLDAMVIVGLFDDKQSARTDLDIPNVQAGGDGMSAGKRQLICLARMVLRRCKIALFDEATSSLDAVAEAKLQVQLASITAGLTSLVIAHRTRTVTTADRVMVLDRGQVAEFGSPTELASNPSSHFAKLLAA